VTPTQLSFQGFEEAPPPIPQRVEGENYFYALRPNGTAIDAIARYQLVCDRRGLSGTSIKPENLHVSLHGFGPDLAGSPSLLADALAAGAAVAAAPFAVAFEHALSFQRKKPEKAFVLRGRDDLIALENFHRLLGDAMHQQGLGDYIAAGFTPHVTLRYTPHLVAEHTVEPISWTVNEFFLLRSLVGHSRHVVLGRWPLRG
jgi:2'-5' RNA ligase